VDPVRQFSEVEYDTYTEREANASGITEFTLSSSENQIEDRDVKS
jgi:hypothetical protein